MAFCEAVAGSPRRQREALVWRHYLQALADEAADAMGCAPATVRALCRHGVANLGRARLCRLPTRHRPGGRTLASPEYLGSHTTPVTWCGSAAASTIALRGCLIC